MEIPMQPARWLIPLLLWLFLALPGAASAADAPEGITGLEGAPPAQAVLAPSPQLADAFDQRARSGERSWKPGPAFAMGLVGALVGGIVAVPLPVLAIVTVPFGAAGGSYLFSDAGFGLHLAGAYLGTAAAIVVAVVAVGGGILVSGSLGDLGAAAAVGVLVAGVGALILPPLGSVLFAGATRQKGRTARPLRLRPMWDGHQVQGAVLSLGF